MLVTLDTTRVDHLSAYGYGRETTPNLEGLAGQAVRYTRAWSVSSWTLPAHASLFTGLYPSAHGARFEARGQVGLGPLRAAVLDERFVTLAELLRQRGYQTGAFVSGPWLTAGFGLLQGFDERDDRLTGRYGRRARETTERALAWLAATDPARPVFLFVNYFDPHDPYEPAEGFDLFPGAQADFHPPPDWWIAAVRADPPVTEAQREALVARYDGEIRAADQGLGRLLEAVRARPDGDRAMIVVTADHGESFGEGGHWLHNACLCEEQVRVPLLVRYPDGRRAGSDDDSPVQLTDVLPMAARELGFAPPPGVQGVLPGKRERAFLELHRNGANVAHFGALYDRDLEAVVAWPFKLVVSSRGERQLLELDGVTESRIEDAQLARNLGEALASHRELVGRAEVRHAEVDERTRESLRALGYVE